MFTFPSCCRLSELASHLPANVHLLFQLQNVEIVHLHSQNEYKSCNSADQICDKATISACFHLLTNRER